MAQKFFIPLRKLINTFLSFDVDSIALEIAKTNAFQTLVIKLNTEGLPTSQLYQLGEDSTGRTLESIGGGYSPFTIEEKKRKGQPTDRVTLKDTGDFYLSFSVIPFKGGFEITANPIKDDTNLFEEWGKEILGLNQVNLQIIINFYAKTISEKINQKLRAA
jgi:hypothetical protein